ncbi:hypothetical protein HYH03_003522 [Edaphochlamys debaryana]|uniref:Uncharacterized protein n=1 Tax=Edaphochlamys debaryana TaxID=47281 RepID=A0A835Y9Y7_9CHLO|nr:hypothetical protein HYH03_003522 [Edaphochlamys debaryana]|eukprot:KAG2498783.1 hypothetical protein HYH03_003522 [Edaphochlamys debaryana]
MIMATHHNALCSAGPSGRARRRGAPRPGPPRRTLLPRPGASLSLGLAVALLLLLLAGPMAVLAERAPAPLPQGVPDAAIQGQGQGQGGGTTRSVVVGASNCDLGSSQGLGAGAAAGGGPGAARASPETPPLEGREHQRTPATSASHTTTPAAADSTARTPSAAALDGGGLLPTARGLRGRLLRGAASAAANSGRRTLLQAPGPYGETDDPRDESHNGFGGADECGPECLFFCENHPSLALSYGYDCPFRKRKRDKA